MPPKLGATDRTAPIAAPALVPVALLPLLWSKQTHKHVQTADCMFWEFFVFLSLSTGCPPRPLRRGEADVAPHPKDWIPGPSHGQEPSPGDLHRQAFEGRTSSGSTPVCSGPETARKARMVLFPTVHDVFSLK